MSRDSTRKQTRHSQTTSGTVIHTYLGVAYHLIGINGACLKKLLSDIKCMTYRYNVNPTSGQGRMELKLFGIPSQSKCGDAIQQLRWQYSRRVKNSRCKLKARIWQPVAEPPRSMHVRVLCWLHSLLFRSRKRNALYFGPKFCCQLLRWNHPMFIIYRAAPYYPPFWLDHILNIKKNLQCKYLQHQIHFHII